MFALLSIVRTLRESEDFTASYTLLATDKQCQFNDEKQVRRKDDGSLLQSDLRANLVFISPFLSFIQLVSENRNVENKNNTSVDKKTAEYENK